MKKLHILFLLSVLFILSSCVIESSDVESLNSGPRAGYEIYLHNDRIMTGNMNKFSLLLTIDGYLSCEDEALRDKIYKPHMAYMAVKDLGNGVYELSRNKIPVYRVETGNKPLSQPDAEWVLTDIRLFSPAKNKSWKAINRDSVFWDFESDGFKTEINGEPTIIKANYSIYCTKNEITLDMLLRELEVYGNLKWHNSITVDCVIQDMVIYREISNKFTGDGTYYSPARIIQGTQNILSAPVSSSRKYSIKSRTSFDEQVVSVEITVMNETEIFRKY